MVRDGKRNCYKSIDKIVFVENCTNEHLFLCLDQSRCLPKKFKCDQMINCIDGSDEIEGCNHISQYFRLLASNKAILHSWYTMILKYSPQSFVEMASDTILLIKSASMLIKLNVFGLKCIVFNGYLLYERKTIYQYFIGKPKDFNNFKCVNEEDTCFDELGKSTCFKCLDGTIISNNQVCNGVVDCQDLSDKCPCEDCKVKPLCEAFYSLKKNNYDFNSIFNVTFELPDGVDEQYCSTDLLFKDSYQLQLVRETDCSKGPTAFNRELSVVPGDVNDYKNFMNLDVWNFRSNISYQPDYQPKAFNSLSDLKGSCNNEMDCPYREDECSQECFNPNIMKSILKFIRCFSFLFENLKLFSVHYRDDYGEKNAIFLFYFNSSML